MERVFIFETSCPWHDLRYVRLITNAIIEAAITLIICYVPDIIELCENERSYRPSIRLSHVLLIATVKENINKHLCAWYKILHENNKDLVIDINKFWNLCGSSRKAEKCTVPSHKLEFEPQTVVTVIRQYTGESFN